MSSKYITARIEIPIEIKPDGSHVKYNDRTQVSFFRCEHLPPKQDYENIRFSEILENLLETATIVSNEEENEDEDEEEPQFIVKKTENGGKLPSFEDEFEDVSVPFLEVEELPENTNISEPKERDGISDNLREEYLFSSESEDGGCNDIPFDKEKSLTEEELVEYFVLKSEILTGSREPSKNTSFKRRILHNKHNISSRR